MTSLVVVAFLIILYATVSKPLNGRGITAALFLMFGGLLTGPLVLGWVDTPLSAASAERLAEVALALLLFSDAARIDLRSLRARLAWPSRLLLIGLPLTMLAGAGAGFLIFPGLSVASVVLLSIMLSSTDAALGQRVVTDEGVPARVRQALNVESGLNDGLAVPFFLVFVDISLAELEGGTVWAIVHEALQQIGYGLLAGVAAGAAGAGLARLAQSRDWLQSPWRQILTLSTALLAYSAAVAMGGSGFIAAFVGGMAFGYVAGARDLPFLKFTEDGGEWLASIVWIGFGALALGTVLPSLTWQMVLYAVVSLTVVRMVPVALAMLGTGARRPTVAFLGWFGPRGLASIVFALIAFDDQVPDRNLLFSVVAVTVGLSVIAHGLSSSPLVAMYHRWYSAHTARRPDAEEAAPTAAPRIRTQPGEKLPAPAVSETAGH